LDRQAKRARTAKRQLGQFLTPEAVARRVLAPALGSQLARILEPSFGAGGFLLPLIDAVIDEVPGRTTNERLGAALTSRIWGVEWDPDLYAECLAAVERRWGPLPAEHNLLCADYFRFSPPPGGFDLIAGNPPFGGTFDADIEDELDQRYGRYAGSKLKKETYSFFVAKALDELAVNGQLRFICSDTFLTIKTMCGLRHKLLDAGECAVERLDTFSDETNHPMVVLDVRRGEPSQGATVFGQLIARDSMERTGNFSWAASGELVGYFDGPTLGEYVVCTGGMTIGKNEWFVRAVTESETIVEPYEFAFFEEPVTLKREREKARLGKLSAAKVRQIQALETAKMTRRNVAVRLRESPLVLPFPHPDYAPYNKASGARLYTPPRYVVYWKDDGDAVLTFKKNGSWYLQGVGGKPYFFREGLTWQLVAPRINARYLPPGYVLDSGAPCAFLRNGVADEELWFVLGWLQTGLATRILKHVLNHTRNIQGKDVERLPYPHWVDSSAKRKVIGLIRAAVEGMVAGLPAPKDIGRTLDALFERAGEGSLEAAA
jgi:hypothetical protein